MLTFAKDRCHLNNTMAYYFMENTSIKDKPKDRGGGSQTRITNNTIKVRIRYPKLIHNKSKGNTSIAICLIERMWMLCETKDLDYTTLAEGTLTLHDITQFRLTEDIDD